MANTYQRPMGATERMRLWFPNINVVVAARITGEIDRDKLHHAVQQARRKHPLLGVRVELDDERRGTFTSAGVPAIPIEVVKQGDWQEVVRRELTHSWPISTGPLVRLTWLPDSSDHTLILNAHHSICDGRSLVSLFRDILDFMQRSVDLDVIKPVSPVSLDEAVPGSGGLLYR